MPELVTAHRWWRRLFWIAVGLGLPVSVLAAVGPRASAPMAFLATLGSAVAVASAAFVTKVFADLQKRWAMRTSDRIDALVMSIISRFGRRYRDLLSFKSQFVDLSGLGTQEGTTPHLEDVFVDLGLTQRALHRMTGGVLAMDDGDDGAAVDLDRRSVWEFLRRDGQVPLVIIGSPGSGKTTLLRYMAIALCAPRRRHPLPILLFLREHAATIVANPEVTLPDVVRSTLGQLADREPPMWLERRLDHRRCVVMLDGLDEIAHEDARAAVIEWVGRQITHYWRCRFVLTSRPHGYQPHALPAATVLQARPFTPTQIRQFVPGWYLATQVDRTGGDDRGVRDGAMADARNLLDQLESSPALFELAVNPLLLTMIANVHGHSETLPRRRADLYEEICQVFLGGRQRSKGIKDVLGADQKELVLRHLALEMMTRRTSTIDRTEAEKVIAPIVDGFKDVTAEDFLRSIEETSGLFAERESGLYSFAHLTLQEYLAAAQLRQAGGSDFLVEHLDEPWWRETVLFYTARADAGPIVAACLDAGTPRAIDLALDCAESAQPLNGELRRKLDEEVSGDIARLPPARRRWRAAILLARETRRVRRLGGTDAYLVRAPVSRAGYELFQEFAGGPGVGPTPSFRRRTMIAGHATGAMIGLSRGEAEHYPAWLVEMLDDPWTYRLVNGQVAVPAGGREKSPPLGVFQLVVGLVGPPFARASRMR